MDGWFQISEDHWARRDGVEIASRRGGDGRLYWFVDAVPDPGMVTVDSPAIAESAGTLMGWIDVHWPLEGRTFEEEDRSMQLSVLCIMAVVFGALGFALGLLSTSIT